MIITRWQAPVTPTLEQMKQILMAEGWEIIEETLNSRAKVSEHRHPFCELRFVAKGELIVSVSGNQFLLREGDRVEIGPNTKHWHSNNLDSECLCLYGQKPV